MQYQAVLFDLDGTLADTEADIVAAGNHAMSQLGRPLITRERCSELVGHGAQHWLRIALGPEHEHLAVQGFRLFMDYYAEHGLTHSRPFPGICDLLAELVRRDIALTILSNKPHPAAVQVANALFGDWPFAMVLGRSEERPAKPHPAGALHIAQSLQVDPGRCLFVGDMSIDINTGNAAGMTTVGVTWGFRDEAELREHGADHIIHHPMELVPIL